MLFGGGCCSRIVLVIAVKNAKSSDSNPEKHLKHLLHLEQVFIVLATSAGLSFCLK